MEEFTTRKGNKLVREVVDDDFKGAKKYIFTLHEPRANGEEISILLDAYLTTPDYFTRKFLEEY